MAILYYAQTFFTGKHTQCFKPHPHPAFFSLKHTLTTTRQSHYIKQKPVTAHLWVAGECVNPLLRKTRVPHAAGIIMFLFPEAGLRAAPSALGCRGQPVPKETSARQQRQMEHSVAQFAKHLAFM